MKQTRKKGRADRKLLIILIGLILVIIVLTILKIMLTVKNTNRICIWSTSRTLSEEIRDRNEPALDGVSKGCEYDKNSVGVI